MKKTDTNISQKMDASEQFCPNEECTSRGQIGQDNIVSHGSKRPRYKCKTCGKTFSARAGTALDGIRKSEDEYVKVITLLAYGTSIQAIVHAFKLDERTVAKWRDRAGIHCESIHKEKVERGLLDLIQAQADEIWVKMRGAVLWVALAIMVPTRLWIAVEVSKKRNSNLTDNLMQQVRRCARSLCAILICTDGFAAYPRSIIKAFRYKVKDTPGPGASKKVVWPRLYIGTVIKRTAKRRVTEVSRRMSYGQWRKAKRLIKASKGGKKLNTSFIERFNGTIRERFAPLTRKCRYAASKITTVHTGIYLIGCVYNFCSPHYELSKSKTKGGYGFSCTPAMASGITDHVWSVKELLTYKVAPPPLPIPKKKDVLARNSLKLYLCLKNLLCDCEKGPFVHPPFRVAVPRFVVRSKKTRTSVPGETTCQSPRIIRRESKIRKLPRVKMIGASKCFHSYQPTCKNKR